MFINCLDSKLSFNIHSTIHFCLQSFGNPSCSAMVGRKQIKQKDAHLQKCCMLYLKTPLKNQNNVCQDVLNH